MKKRRFLSAFLALVTAAGTAIGAAGAASAADTSPYKDVKTKRWSYPEIMYATENGYMNGMGGGYFKPEDTMTRAMVVTVLYRFQGSPAVEYKKTFTDIKEKDWYADAVLWAAENDIVNGVSDGVFAPMDNITRQQLAAILMRYAPQEYVKTDNRKDITGYKDYKKVQAYAKDAMSWANATGLITGVTTSTLEPTSGATREQFAVILKRFKEGEGFDYELVYNTPNYSTSLDQSIELVTDADIYVAVDGNDSNAGTLDKPIATFARAKEMVRELKKTATDEIVVAFKAGNYGALDNITFTADDGGSESVPIRYTAYGDGEVLFSNGLIIKNEEFQPISSDEYSMFPESSRDKIYKVDLTGRLDELTDSNSIFSESGTCYEARFPNKYAEGTDNCYKNFTTRYEDPDKDEFEYDTIILSGLAARAVDSFSTVEGIKVTGYLRTGWLIDTFKVKSYDTETKHLTFDFSNRECANGYSLDEYCLAFEGRMDDTVFFHNLPELLDHDGEYWFDSKTHSLYVYNPDGDYTIAEGARFVTLEGGAEHISFVGLSFSGCTYRAVTVRAKHTTFDKCCFANIGGDLVFDAFYVTDFTLTNSELKNFVCGGVNLQSSANKRLLESGNNVISGNYFHDFGQPQYFANSNAVGFSDIGAVVSHNVFRNGAHGAVCFDGLENVIEYNVFDNMMMTTQDYGAVYTWNCVGYRDNIIRYNLFTNMAAGDKYAIYLDDNTSGQQVYGNIFYEVKGATIVLHGGRDNTVHDNIFVRCSMLAYTEGLIEADDPYGSTFYENLINQRPSEDDEMYATWAERWPMLYKYTFDPADAGKYECAFTVINHIKNNSVIGGYIDFDETGDKYGDIENNIAYSTDENPFFTDPTHGDYTVKSGAGIISEEHSSKMGMYGLK